MKRLSLVFAFARDLRYALHSLRRSPAFTVTAILTLTFVIGANTAVLSLADAILIKPLPYPQPERLAQVDVGARTGRGEFVIDAHDGTTWEWLQSAATAIDVAVTAGGSGFGRDVNLAVGDVAYSVGQERVSAGYFRVLGVSPAVGREFSADEDRPGSPAVAVLSYDLWQRVFNGEPSAIGQSLLLRGEPHEVVGVMPQRFRSLAADVDVWTPVRPSTTGEGGGANYEIVARVKPGYTLAEALAAMPPLDDEYFRRMGISGAESAPTGRFALVSMQAALTAGVARPLLTLVAAVGMVLLIACANLATLLLARAESRRREIATRMALGSGRAGVVRQLFAESLVLGALGGALGFAVGYVGLEGIKAIAGPTLGAWAGATLDTRAIAITAGLVLLTSVLFGLFPAFNASRLDISAALSEGGGRGIAGGARGWTRRLLVGTEIALGVVLLVVTGLLVRTFVNLTGLEPGFDAANVTTASISLQDARYATAADMNRLFDESLRRIEGAPGVESAAVSLELPYRRLLNMNFAFADEAAPTGPRITNVMYATPGLFGTLRIPLQVGRLFSDGDGASATPVVIVSQDFVSMLANGESPIGRRIRLAGAEREIVGVVGNVKVTSAGFELPAMLDGPLTSAPLVYLPAAQTPDAFMGMHQWFSPMWTVRARDQGVAETILRQAIGGADPLLPVGSVRRMADIRAAATTEQRLLMILVGVLAAAALLLSALGIYGLVAHTIADRRRELAVRMALGATAAQTVRSTALSGVGLACAAAAVGLGLAWIAARALDALSILWGVESRDPGTFVSVAVFAVLVASLASVVPAFKILSLDPAETLRD